METLSKVLILIHIFFTCFPSTGSGWKLIWSENFNPCNEMASCSNGLRNSVWSFEEGDGIKYGPYLIGWGNKEMQCYTAESRNARVLDRAPGAQGVLVIEAHFHENGFTCLNPGAAPSTRWWTSARLITRDKKAFVYDYAPIKIEARVKVPQELGAWPAFWLLPDTKRTDCLACGDYGNGWCTSGEIDVLEARNRDGVFSSALHYGGIPGQDWLGCQSSVGTLNVSALSSTTYWTRVSVVWGPSNITFYVNDTVSQTINQIQWYTGAVAKNTNPLAPFDRPFYMLLNLAIGGNYVTAQTNDGLITDTRKAPYKYMVDWIRVYQ